jgi:hypothetical protein
MKCFRNYNLQNIMKKIRKRWLFAQTSAAANTTGEFLRRFCNRTIWGLGKIVLETGVKIIRACGIKCVTLDVDAFFLESQKAEVQMNYEGLWGYNPVAVTCAELKMPLAGIFRDGNASPMADLRGLLR